MSSFDQEASLTLKDRINFPYILANQILTFQKAILATEYSSQEIRESIEAFVHVIPSNMKDKQFQEDLQKARIKNREDVRPIMTGQIRMSEETCLKLGLPTFKEKEVYDYYLVFQACMDLLNRRGMVSKINRVEELESIEFDNITDKEVKELEDLGTE